MYFNSTLTDSSKLLKPLLVFTFIICGIICGLTRITQYKNHPVDVYCGFLIGGGIALYLVNNLLLSYKPKFKMENMQRIFCTIITSLQYILNLQGNGHISILCQNTYPTFNKIIYWTLTWAKNCNFKKIFEFCLYANQTGGGQGLLLIV